jgi:hypothetical protein
MHESIQTYPEKPRIIESEKILEEGYKLGHNEKVFITSTFSEKNTFLIKNHQIPVSYASIAIIRLGNEEKYDEFEFMAIPNINSYDNVTYDDVTFFVRVTNPDEPGWEPVPIFNIIGKDGPGIIGKSTKPTRNYECPNVSRNHIRVNSDGNILAVENLEPQSQTVLFSSKSKIPNQSKFLNLSH